MSLTFNMVGGGVGGFKNTDAVLIVTVPTGSTVTATKSGTTLTPTMWVKAADASLDCAIFSIPASKFDSTTPWTVTATLGEDTASDTVIVNAANEYDVVLTYYLWLYKEGNIYSSVTGGYSKVYNSSGSSGSFVLGENSATVKGASGDNVAECGCTTVSDVDLTEISYLKINVLSYSAGTTNYPGGYMAISKTAGFVAAANAAAFVKCNAVGVRVIDVSTFSGKYYIKVMGAAQSGTITFDKIWGEQ